MDFKSLSMNEFIISNNNVLCKVNSSLSLYCFFQNFTKFQLEKMISTYTKEFSCGKGGLNMPNLKKII